MLPKVLTIAGSEASGGAGQLADLKVFEEYGVYGLVALTCIVTMDPHQNFMPSIHELDSKLLHQQLETAFVDHDLSAVKTGMLATEQNIQLVADTLQKETPTHIVIDPVMVCKQGDAQFGLSKAIQTHLLPLATITTPNLIEAEALSELSNINTVEDMKEAAKIIHDKGAQSVVVKGGHRLQGHTAYDVFYDGRTFDVLEAPMIENNYNHGAGCTFAAAITAGLALGYSTTAAVRLAKSFVNEGIKHGFMANHYTGHIWHGAYNHAEKRMHP